MIPKSLNERIKPGRAYLIKEATPDKGFEIFTALMTNEDKAMCISGIHPNDIKRKYDLDKASFIWLTQNQDVKKNYVHPSNISRTGFVLKNFLKENKNTAVFLEGLEHLFIHNRYETVMSFLYTINDEVAVNKAKMLVLMDPFALSRKQMVFLENELEELIL
jgi:hypothetical protein